MSSVVGAISCKSRVGVAGVNKALGVLRHRGPDGREIVEGQWGVLGANRLSIDESTSSVIAKQGDVFLALDGNVLNPRELNDHSGADRRNSGTDDFASAALSCYLAEAEDVFSRIIGSACFAIVDARRKKVFLVRDRMGIHPLYYRYCDGILYFASEIKAILTMTPDRPSPDPEAVMDYLTLQCCIGDKTLFSEIKKVPPGGYVEWDYSSSNSPESKTYWRLDFTTDFSRSESDLICEVRSLIEDSVRLNVNGVDSSGIYLSGGLDSSAVASFAARLAPEREFKTVCGKYLESPEYDESRYARCVAESVGSAHTDITITVDEFPELMSKIVYLMDEPQGGPGVYGQYVVGREMGKHVKVALSGEGGDELFLGYAKYLIAYLEECLRGAIFETVDRGDFVVTLQSIIGSLPLLTSYRETLQGFWSKGLFEPKESRYFDLCDRLRTVENLVSPDVFDIDYDVRECFTDALKETPTSSHINMMSRCDIMGGLQSVLQVDDRTSMAHSVENRPPLLDHRLVQLVASVPPKVKFSCGRQKYLFRNAIVGVVPDQILARKDKKGFPVPLNQWFAGPLKDYVSDILLSKRSKERGIFTREGLVALLAQQQQFGRALWGALNLELWFQTFIDLR